MATSGREKNIKNINSHADSSTDKKEFSLIRKNQMLKSDLKAEIKKLFDVAEYIDGIFVTSKNVFSAMFSYDTSNEKKRGLKSLKEDYVKFLGHEFFDENSMMQWLICRENAEGNPITKYILLSYKTNSPIIARKKIKAVFKFMISIGQEQNVPVRMLNTEERCKVLHDIMRPNRVGKFSAKGKFGYPYVKKNSLSLDDCFCPLSIDKKSFSDRVFFGDVMFQGLAVYNFPPSLSDKLLIDLYMQDFPCITCINIKPYGKEKGKLINQMFFSLEGQLQNIFDFSLSILHFSNSDEELENHYLAFKKITAKHHCRLHILENMQMDFIRDILPLGKQSLHITKAYTENQISMFLPYANSNKNLNLVGDVKNE